MFRGFDLAPFGPSSRAQDGLGWPQIDIDETDKELRITAELLFNNVAGTNKADQCCQASGAP
jgi:HSP20 family molecular chaperone IbpA